MALFGAPAASATAQGSVAVTVGDSAFIAVVRGRVLNVPVKIAPAGGMNFASLQANLLFSPARFHFDSISNGTFSSNFTKNLANAGSGSLTVAWFNVTGQTAPDLLATMSFHADTARAGAISFSTLGGSRVRLSPSAAGNQAGANILGNLVLGDLDVCVVTGVWGDVNDDGTVNIVDAQQLARRAVGLTVANDSAALQRGDVTNDGSINIVDAQQLARFAVGLASAARINTPAYLPLPVGSVVVTPGGAQNVAVGATLSLSADPQTAGATSLLGCRPVTWQTSDATKATVTAQGVVTGIATGSATITASSGGVSTPVNVTVGPATPSIVSTAFATHLDSLYSLGDTVRRVPTSRDGSNALTAGAYTYLSRNAAFATVSASGLITAVANGATYIVATEAGGTKDSTLVVVQQRISSITVTPGTRSVYRTRTFQFSASAVDGRGNAVSLGTAYTWTSTAVGVATIDSTTGLLTAVGLGATQVRATAGAIVGVANVTVLTPITRIVVGRDSSGVPATDTTTVTSLGVARTYRAQARDTADAPMSGVTFTFASTNPTVAPLDSLNPATARALTNANGITTIQATADGITGSATFKVQQVLAAVELTPTPDTIGVAGTVQLVARGKDANGRYISGVTVTYATSSAPVATVNASGVVTGVALGTANITATSTVNAGIVSNAAAIVVSNAVSPIISFGRDTLTVGRGLGVSIPVFLSRPSGSAVTVNLAARDTNAYFSVGSVTFPSGTTAVNVTLNGRNAGTTRIYATDGSGTGYAGDTAVVAVQANVRFSSNSWYLNNGDQVATQVLLSDPSPAGGTFVTFSYGTAGRAQVSPDPAFIPAGQLASNVVITATGAGNTTITPVATGVNGTASTMNVSAAVLSLSSLNYQLGAGQYETNFNVQVPQYTSAAIPVTLTTSDASVVTVSPSATIAPGGYYATFTISGVNPGTARVIATAPGWTPDTMYMTVSSPRTTICCGQNLNTTSPQGTLTVYSTDSSGTGHYRTSSLVVRVTSSDTTVIKVIDSLTTIAAGAYYNSGIRFIPGGAGGTAWLKVVAGGHRPDSVLATVVGPKLQFSWCCTNLIGKGQTDPNQNVQTPNYIVGPLTVTLTNSNPAKVTVPASITIPNGGYYQTFGVIGVDTGLVSIIASAPGYQPDTAFYRVTSPRVTVCCSNTLNNFGGGTGYTVYAVDSTGSSHNRTTPLTVSLRSTDTTVLRIDSSSVTIAANSYYNNAAHISSAGPGTAYIVATAPGHRPDSSVYTVNVPKLSFSFTNATIGQRQQYGATDLYISTPDYRPSALAVTLVQKHGTIDSIPVTALSIPTNSYYSYFGLFALTTGADTIIATAPGYQPDTAFLRVTSKRLTVSSIPSTGLTTSSAVGFTVYAVDSTGNSHYAMDTVTLHVTSSDSNVIKPTQAYVRIPRGQYYVQSQFTYTGPGVASITVADSAGTGPGYYPAVTTNSVTVTGPSLIFSSANAMFGMRQKSGTQDYYVYTSGSNNVVTPLTVTLTSTDPRVATVPATVTIPAGSYYAYFTITALDTVGTIQVRGSAVGYGVPTPMNVQVTQPHFAIGVNPSVRTTQGAQSITVYAEDANGATHYTTEDVTVTLASSATSVATVDSATVTIKAGQYYHNTSHWNPVATGTTQLSATDGRAALYAYGTATANLTVTTPAAHFSWSSAMLGLGQYIDPVYDGSYYVSTPDYMAAVTSVNFSHQGASHVTIPATGSIAAGSYYSYLRITGVSRGADTIVANIASPFHSPATAVVQVDSGRIDTFGNWPGASMHVGDSVLVTLTTHDPSSTTRRVLNNESFSVTGLASLEIHKANAVVTSVTVPADGTFVQFYLKAVAAGTGTATFSNANYKTYSPPNVTVIP